MSLEVLENLQFKICRTYQLLVHFLHFSEDFAKNRPEPAVGEFKKLLIGSMIVKMVNFSYESTTSH